MPRIWFNFLLEYAHVFTESKFVKIKFKISYLGFNLQHKKKVVIFVVVIMKIHFSGSKCICFTSYKPKMVFGSAMSYLIHEICGGRSLALKYADSVAKG